MSDRCPTCDREGTNCPTLEVLVRSTVSSSEARKTALAAMRDCRAHAVDWRSRALAAEARAAEVEARTVEQVASWIEYQSRGPSLISVVGRNMAAEVRAGAWHSAGEKNADRRGPKMGNCACGVFSSQLNAAGQCMACASRSTE